MVIDKWQTKKNPSALTTKSFWQGTTKSWAQQKKRQNEWQESTKRMVATMLENVITDEHGYLYTFKVNNGELVRKPLIADTPAGQFHLTADIIDESSISPKLKQYLENLINSN